MQHFYAYLEDGKKGTVWAENKLDAEQLITKHFPEIPIIKLGIIPYPAFPDLTPVPENYKGFPHLCYSPGVCINRAACPKRIACSE